MICAGSSAEYRRLFGLVSMSVSILPDERQLVQTLWQSVFPQCLFLCNAMYNRVGRKWKNLSDFLCHGDVNIGYRIILNSEIASSLPCAL